MAEPHCRTLTAAGRKVHQRARNGRSGADRHRCRAHHRVVQLAHRQCAHQEVDLAGRHLPATRRHVPGRLGHERDLRRVLALACLVDAGDEAHAQRAVGADRLEHGQCARVAIDRVLQLGAIVAQRPGLDEDGRDARVDQRGAQHAHTGHVEFIDQIPGREHGAATALFLGGRVHELELHLGCREGHAIELEVARFLHLARGHRHVREDGLADIGLPDAHHGHAVVRHARRIDQACGNRERPDCRRQVAAITAPVDERLVDRDLAEQVVDVVLSARGRRDDHGLAGAGRGATHAVDLLAVRVGAADHAQQQRIACGARHAGLVRQVVQLEEHALAGAAAQIGGGDPALGRIRG